jgi:hypothetical protein
MQRAYSLDLAEGELDAVLQEALVGLLERLGQLGHVAHADQQAGQALITATTAAASGTD